MNSLMGRNSNILPVGFLILSYMKYQEYRPHAELIPYVEFFWTLTGVQSSADSVECIFPDGRTELIIHFADPFVRHYESGEKKVQPKAFIIGQLERPLKLQQGHHVQVVAARFRPDGAFPLVNHPLSELSMQETSLRYLWGAWGDELVSRISEHSTPRARVCALESGLRSRLRHSDGVDSVVRHISSSILRQDGNVHIHRLARDTGLSVRTMQRRFREQVGLSPRSFAQVVRFQSALRMIDADSNHSMVATAIDSGYYDQPHFVRNFKRFTGLSPGEYMSDRHGLSDLFTATDMSQSYKI